MPEVQHKVRDAKVRPAPQGRKPLRHILVEVGSGDSRVALISIAPGSRPAAAAELSTMSRLRIQSSSLGGMKVFHMSACRPTSRSPICSP